MSALKIKVPVTLTRNDDGFSIEVETDGGQSAMISLDGHGPMVNTILRDWASERFHDAMLKTRRNTGLKDVANIPVFEGDIVERFDLPGYKEVLGVVKWDAERAAFIMEGQWPDEKLWQSHNLRAVQAARIVGNVFQNPGVLKPCKPIQPEKSQDTE